MDFHADYRGGRSLFRTWPGSMRSRARRKVLFNMLKLLDPTGAGETEGTIMQLFLSLRRIN